MSDSLAPEEAAMDAGKARLRAVKPPAREAVVFICQRCERRVHAEKGSVRQLARRIKKLSKEALGKGSVRTVMTSCMSQCPRDAISIALVSRRAESKPRMYMADAAKPKAAARELVSLLVKP